MSTLYLCFEGGVTWRGHVLLHPERINMPLNQTNIRSIALVIIDAHAVNDWGLHDILP